MYQVKFTCGYEIQVVGQGERGLCRVKNQQYDTVKTGTYAECEKWLNDRRCERLDKRPATVE